MKPLNSSVSLLLPQKSFVSKTRKERLRTCSSDSGCDVACDSLDNTDNALDNTIR